MKRYLAITITTYGSFGTAVLISFYSEAITHYYIPVVIFQLIEYIAHRTQKCSGSTRHSVLLTCTSFGWLWLIS